MFKVGCLHHLSLLRLQDHDVVGTDMIEPTPLGPCIKLVSDSMKERKERADEEERLRLLSEQTTNKKTLSTASSSPRSVNSVVTSPKDVPKEPAVKIFSDEPMVTSPRKT